MDESVPGGVVGASAPVRPDTPDTTPVPPHGTAARAEPSTGDALLPRQHDRRKSTVLPWEERARELADSTAERGDGMGGPAIIGGMTMPGFDKTTIPASRGERLPSSPSPSQQAATSSQPASPMSSASASPSGAAPTSKASALLRKSARKTTQSAKNLLSRKSSKQSSKKAPAPWIPNQRFPQAEEVKGEPKPRFAVQYNEADSVRKPRILVGERTGKRGKGMVHCRVILARANGDLIQFDLRREREPRVREIKQLVADFYLGPYSDPNSVGIFTFTDPHTRRNEKIFIFFRKSHPHATTEVY